MLHEKVVLLTIASEHARYVKPAERIDASTTLGEGFYRVVARFGYMETPNVPELLEARARSRPSQIDLARTTYYLGRETLIAEAAAA